VPDTLHDVDLMVRDNKRTGAACGFACHTIVKAKDYVFTGYPKR
jgi:hypothetical protein